MTGNAETIPILVKFLHIGSGWPTTQTQLPFCAILARRTKRTSAVFGWPRWILTGVKHHEVIRHADEDALE